MPGPGAVWHLPRCASYPFDSNGAVAKRSIGIGYALEVQGKSHYAGSASGPNVSPGTLAHEIAQPEFIAVAKERSGLQGAELALLETYFRQWLYRTTKPTVVPAYFA